jgi:hypothetical protein
MCPADLGVVGVGGFPSVGEGPYVLEGDVAGRRPVTQDQERLVVRPGQPQKANDERQRTHSPYGISNCSSLAHRRGMSGVAVTVGSVPLSGRSLPDTRPDNVLFVDRVDEISRVRAARVRTFSRVMLMAAVRLRSISSASSCGQDSRSKKVTRRGGVPGGRVRTSTKNHALRSRTWPKWN